MSFKIKNKKQVAKSIEQALIRQFYNTVVTVMGNIEREIKQKNIEFWKNTSTYDSLINGRLTHEFGIPKGEASTRLDNILKIISTSINVPFPKIPKVRSGGTFTMLRINVLQTFNPANVLDYAGSKVTTEKGRDLPWLKWLLYEGNKYLIFGHEYTDISSPRSRSGKGLMVVNPNEDWKVPPEFSGTRNNNWLSRALIGNTEVEREYAKIIERNIRQASVSDIADKVAFLEAQSARGSNIIPRGGF